MSHPALTLRLMDADARDGADMAERVQEITQAIKRLLAAEGGSLEALAVINRLAAAGFDPSEVAFTIAHNLSHQTFALDGEHQLSERTELTASSS